MLTEGETRWWLNLGRKPRSEKFQFEFDTDITTKIIPRTQNKPAAALLNATYIYHCRYESMIYFKSFASEVLCYPNQVKSQKIRGLDLITSLQVLGLHHRDNRYQRQLELAGARWPS